MAAPAVVHVHVEVDFRPLMAALDNALEATLAVLPPAEADELLRKLTRRATDAAILRAQADAENCPTSPDRLHRAGCGCP